MRRLKHVLLGICVLAAGVVRGAAGADFSETLLSAGAKAVWDLDKAFRETTYSASGSASTGCGSGSRHLLSMLIVAMPLSAVQMSFSDTNASFEAGTRPWSFTCGEQYNVRRTYRRASFELARLRANMGVAAPTPLLERFHAPVTATRPEKRWLSAFYLDQPEEWDDPYRFFNW